MAIQNIRKNNKKEEKKKQIRVSVDRWQWIAIVSMLCLNMIVIVLMGLNYYMSRRQIAAMESQITYLSDTTSIIRANLETLQEDWKVKNEGDASLLGGWDIRLKDMNFADRTYCVEIIAVPKEYTEKTKASIYFGTKGFPLTLDGYQFVGEADLMLEESYDGNVTVLMEDGATRKTEILSTYADVRTNLNDVLSGKLFRLPAYQDGKLLIDTTGAVNLDGKEFFSFDHLTMVVESKEGIIREYDLASMAVGESAEGIEEKPEADVFRAFGDMLGNWDQKAQEEAENAVAIPGREESSPYPLNWLSYNFTLTDEIEFHSEEVRIYLKASAESGYVFTYDLYRAAFPEEEKKEEEEGQAVQQPTAWPVRKLDESSISCLADAAVYDPDGAVYRIPNQ